MSKREIREQARNEFNIITAAALPLSRKENVSMAIGSIRKAAVTAVKRAREKEHDVMVGRKGVSAAQSKVLRANGRSARCGASSI